MKQHNTDFWPFLDYFDQYHKYNEAGEGFFFLGPLRTIHQLFPEQKTKCVSVLVCTLQAYNKTQVQKLHLTLAEPIYYFGIFYLKIGKFYTFFQLGKGPVMGPKII